MNNNNKKNYSEILINCKNMILHGAPGTGKTYLARQIAAEIVSNGECSNYDDLPVEQKKQIGFIQFHPSYDYSDFVEGLRPKQDNNGNIGFELQDGLFSSFLKKAKKEFDINNYNIQHLEFVLKTITQPLEDLRKRKFYLYDIKPNNIITIYCKEQTGQEYIINLDWNELVILLASNDKYKTTQEITDRLGLFFLNDEEKSTYSCMFCLYKKIQDETNFSWLTEIDKNKLKKYVFIIDEINRGEISKIFGELFFSIDPEYRGKKGEVFTQYSNLHTDPNEKFYVPENVYIIGTMNDIDRSVDSFDFAMRRRFRFIEITPEESVKMHILDSLEKSKKDEALSRMGALNTAITNIPELNENYKIGPAYFLKLQNLSSNELWTDHLKPLLQDYVRGLYKEDKILLELANAYGYSNNSTINTYSDNLNINAKSGNSNVSVQSDNSNVSGYPDNLNVSGYPDNINVSGYPDNSNVSVHSDNSNVSYSSN